MELLKGLEPPTYALQVRCTTYCATAAYSIVFSHSCGLTKLLMFNNRIERYFNHTTPHSPQELHQILNYATFNWHYAVPSPLSRSIANFGGRLVDHTVLVAGTGLEPVISNL